MRNVVLISITLLLTLTGCVNLDKVFQVRHYDPIWTNTSQTDTTITSVTNNIDSSGNKATLISAFYGLDDGLPKPTNIVMCDGAEGSDGMPIIFSHEIDNSTMEPGDFRITLASGEVGKIYCTTLAPAEDKGELRTALFSGDYGSKNNQPVKIEIIGNILSLDGTMNFKGVSLDITPLEAGPKMVFAEIVPEEEWDVGKEATELHWGGGSGAPEGCKQIIRVVWDGGVTKPGRDEIDDNERVKYEVTILLDDGNVIKVTPFAIADLGDGDNNHELCLDVEGTPQSVFFPAGYMTDPNEDLNLDSTITIKMDLMMPI